MLRCGASGWVLDGRVASRARAWFAGGLMEMVVHMPASTALAMGLGAKKFTCTLIHQATLLEWFKEDVGLGPTLPESLFPLVLQETCPVSQLPECSPMSSRLVTQPPVIDRTLSQSNDMLHRGTTSSCRCTLESFGPSKSLSIYMVCFIEAPPQLQTHSREFLAPQISRQSTPVYHSWDSNRRYQSGDPKRGSFSRK